jgi:predicted nucleic acid-binding protein
VPGRYQYVDSSAAVKLVLTEPESRALREFLRRWPRQVTSVLARVEVARAVRRRSEAPALVRRASLVMDRLGQLDVTDAILADAIRLEPRGLRTLDSLHLASARALGRDLGGFVTYDEDLAEAARGAGLEVFAPR